MKRRHSTHSRFKRTSEAVFGPNTSPRYRYKKLSKVLLVENEFYTGFATWIMRDNVWSCIAADNCLLWMRGLPQDQIKNELLKRGCSWEWLHNPDPHDKPDDLSAGQARSPKPPSIDEQDAVSNIGGARQTNTRSGEPWSGTAPTVASLSLQTGAQPTAALASRQVAYRDKVVSTAGG